MADNLGAGALPAAYAWLRDETGPRMILEALKLFGTLEAPGARDNPTIIGWAREVDLIKTYSHDSIPWCGLFMAVVAKRAGKPIVDSPLWALSWSDFGRASPVPMLGDVLTFKRNGGGHVALYVGEDASAFHCLGGNQSDRVCITRIAKSRLYRARRPAYNVQPDNVRKVTLAANGKLSTNEA
jgi:uncharacterized protein (TIGR02594 family)